MAAHDKIVPPNFKRFWKWYLRHCGEKDYDLSREIEPPDFELYHKWEYEQMSQIHTPKKEKTYTHLAGVIALALAVDAGKIDEELFKYEQKDFISFAYRTFAEEMRESGVKNPETNESTYRAKRRLIISHVNYKAGLDWAKNKKTDHYSIGERLFETHFHT